MDKLLDKIDKCGIAFYQKYSRVLWLLFLIVFSVISYRCFWFALESSLDMQWYPTLQFWGLGKFDIPINPYLAHLQGDVFMANGPNYMPLLYMIMYPIGLLDWTEAKVVFALLNFIFFCLTVCIFVLKSKHRAYVALFSSLVLLGFTYGNVVANGQTTILMGFFITLAYFYRHNFIILTFALTLVLIKHSVGVPIMFGFFIAGYRKEVLCACGIMIGFIVVASLKFDINPIDLIRMMLQVNALTYTSPGAMGGPGDLVSLSQKIFHKPYSLITAITVLIGMGMVWCVWKNKPHTSQIVAASIVLSLIALPHLGYDYYLLFIAMILVTEKNRFDLRLLFFLVVSLFLWRGSFLKPWIDATSNWIIPSNAETFWAMNMGIPFCIAIVVCFVVIIFSTLTKKENV